MKNKFLVVFGLFFLPQLLFSQNEKPDNIILVVANGLGYGHLSYISHELKNADLLVKYEANGIVYTTDECRKHHSPSVAIATGQIPEPKAAGIDIAGNKVATLLEIAKENKKAIGLVSAASVTDPINAVFFTHQKNMEKSEAVALDLFQLQPELIIAGGLKFFKNRTDNRDLMIEFKKGEYKIITDAKDITKGSQPKTIALIDNENLPGAKQRDDFYVKAFQRAFKTLIKHDNGYFLVITLPHIKWSAKENNTEKMKDELEDLMNLISKINLFTADDSKTLVIIVSDTDTGALVVVPDDKSTVKWSSKENTPMTIPVFANGNGADLFRGYYPSTSIFQKISSLLIK